MCIPSRAHSPNDIYIIISGAAHVYAYLARILFFFLHLLPSFFFSFFVFICWYDDEYPATEKKDTQTHKSARIWVQISFSRALLMMIWCRTVWRAAVPVRDKTSRVTQNYLFYLPQNAILQEFEASWTKSWSNFYFCISIISSTPDVSTNLFLRWIK